MIKTSRSLLTSVVFCVLVNIIFFHTIAYAAGYIFTRTLKIGVSGEDVRKLQKILNSDPDTQVQASGPGSSGQETAYFGALTGAAVVRFQEKYKGEVLLPNGLSAGTGFVGQATLAKLKSFTGLQNEGISTPTAYKTGVPSPSTGLYEALARGVLPVAAAFAAISPSEVYLFGLSHTKIKSGDQLSITGAGFDSDNTVHIGSAAAVHSVATSSTNMEIQVPVVPSGKYKIWITNSHGSTENVSSLYIVIGEVTDSRPSIESVSPARVSSGGNVTVRADKLDAGGNIVYSNIGIIKSVPSTDGRTMLIKVDDLPNSKAFQMNQSVNEFTVTFSIETQAGRSLNYGYFVITK